MSISIFLSHPQPYLNRQKEFIQELTKYLQAEDLQPRTLGVTDYDMNAPLAGIRRLLLESNGLITVAFRRGFIEKGKDKPNSDIGQEERDLSNNWLTSPFCQIEPAMAFQLGLPILILREKGVRADGILERGVIGIYMPEFDLDSNPNSFFQSTEWIQLIRQWVTCVRNVAYNKEFPSQLY